MTMQLVVESGNDYRRLPDLLREEGYEVEAEAGQDIYVMANGRRCVYTLYVETHAGDTEFIDFVQENSEGLVEARTEGYEE